LNSLITRNKYKRDLSNDQGESTCNSFTVEIPLKSLNEAYNKVVLDLYEENIILKHRINATKCM
jgi:hypothetical protein